MHMFDARVFTFMIDYLNCIEICPYFQKQNTILISQFCLCYGLIFVILFWADDSMYHTRYWPYFTYFFIIFILLLPLYKQIKYTPDCVPKGVKNSVFYSVLINIAYKLSSNLRVLDTPRSFFFFCTIFTRGINFVIFYLLSFAWLPF